jgi:predicted RNA-binding protein with PIN domain
MSRAQDHTIFIDGYNVAKRPAAWRDLPLLELRERLLQLVQRIRWPVPVHRIVIVFDGGEPGLPSRAVHGHIDVRFAAPSADAYIQEAIRASRTPQRLLIVSDDQEILRTARSHGAQRHSAKWLLDRADAAPKPSGRPHETPDKPSLPARTARRITEELEQRWLRPPSDA